jgi:hypothetical protein
MNVDTGKVYTTESEIRAARERGENLVPVSKRVAELMSFARQERTRQARNKRKAARRKAAGR